jgi:hypothetical protein
LDRFGHLLPQVIALALLFGLFFAISRGLAIFDDYAHLPTLSLMAAGDIPPHFSLDPRVPYGYHYFLLLLAAQMTRLSSWFPWTAWDAARTGSCPGGAARRLWARRVTQLRRFHRGGRHALFGRRAGCSCSCHPLRWQRSPRG